MRGFSFLGKDPQVPRADLFKNREGNIYRKVRGSRELELVKRLDDPGLAPVAYSTRKRMGKPVREFVEENDLCVNQVKELEQVAKRCGFCNLSEIYGEEEMKLVLKKAAQTCTG